jgi:hypothetical protein
MTPRRKDIEVNILYQEDGFRARTGHWVRTSEEAMVCSWLEKRDVVHRHASKIFRLSSEPDTAPRTYIPSITLDHLNKKGKTLIIEPLDSYGLTLGKMKLLTEFRRQHGKTHSVVVLVKRQSLRKVPKDARDTLISLEDIKTLEEVIPLEEP